MTQTAIELWYDDDFLYKRIKEQEYYLIDLELRRLDGLNEERYWELRNTAEFMKWVFEYQLHRPRPTNITYN